MIATQITASIDAEKETEARMPVNIIGASREDDARNMSKRTKVEHTRNLDPLPPQIVTPAAVLISIGHSAQMKISNALEPFGV